MAMAQSSNSARSWELKWCQNKGLNIAWEESLRSLSAKPRVLGKDCHIIVSLFWGLKAE